MSVARCVSGALLAWRSEVSEQSAPAGMARFRKLWATREAISATSPRLVQARALILCALPYTPTAERSVTRTAQIGPGVRLSVTFTSVEPGVALPFGADRALFGWIQTQAIRDDFVSLASLTGFFQAFDLHPSGRAYQCFRARLARLECLAISVRIDGPEESLRLHLHPLKQARIPRAFETSDQAPPPTQILRRSRYGFSLDPDFLAYLRANPVPLSLPLMRLFHGRPKAWDLTAFVLYRSFVAKRPSVVPWSDLMAQLGSQDTYPRRLKATLSQVLAEIRVVHPDLGARFLPAFGGLQIVPWRPVGDHLGRRRLRVDHETTGEPA